MEQDGLSPAPEIVLLDGTRLPAGFPVECRWVTEQIAFGGMIGTAANVAALRRARVTHVLNLQSEFDDAPLLRGAGIQLCWLGVPDTLDPFPTAAIHGAVAFAREAFVRLDHRLFVHCMAGRSRSPTFVYAILRATGWPADAALGAILRADTSAWVGDEHLDAVERCLTSIDAPYAGAPARARTESP